MLIISWLIDPEDQDREEQDPEEQAPEVQKTRSILMTVNWCFICLAMLGGAFAAVGGTILQLAGVYRNCVCKAGLRYLVNHAGGTVELATDTQLDRDSWIVWWSNGIAALVFYSSVLIFTCFYNMWMKENCKSIIDQEKKLEEEVELDGG
jgi:hypothetical protein